MLAGPRDLIKGMSMVQSQSDLEPVLDQPGRGGGGA